MLQTLTLSGSVEVIYFLVRLVNIVDMRKPQTALIHVILYISAISVYNCYTLKT